MPVFSRCDTCAVAPVDAVDVETTRCNICGGEVTRLLFETQDYRYRVDDQRYGVWQCRSCGLGYLNPRPTRDAIRRYYPNAYYRHRDDVSQGGRLTAQARYL